MKLRRVTFAAVAIICWLLALVACERPIRIGLDGKNPPTFTFRGTGQLVTISMYEVTDGKIPPIGSESWQIEPLGLLQTPDCPPITYGVLPSGFAQLRPARGTSIPPLREGHTYGFGATTRDVRSSTIWF